MEPKWKSSLDKIVQKNKENNTKLDFVYFIKLAKWVVEVYGTSEFEYRLFIFEELSKKVKQKVKK